VPDLREFETLTETAMIYMKSANGEIKVVVLESTNLEQLKQGHVVHTPDKSVVIAWTADPVWLADKILDVKDGDVMAVARLIEESAKRPEKPRGRPYHETHEHTFREFKDQPKP